LKVAKELLDSGTAERSLVLEVLASVDAGVPSEDGVVKDVLTLYNFIKSYQNQSRIFFWGHSLGAG
jgi:hypothetical protein